MIVRVTYDSQYCRNSGDCVRAIRDHLDRDWELSQFRGAGGGPFVLVFRKSVGEGPRRADARHRPRLAGHSYAPEPGSRPVNGNRLPGA